MELWGFAIPGLAMAADELPKVDGLFRLENPEVGDGIGIGRNYTLEEVADRHLQTISENLPPGSQSPVLIGLSMGGMITQILASQLRSRLPVRTQFRLLSTSLNSAAHPAIPDSMLDSWTTVRPGDRESFRHALMPFFSKNFLQSNPRRFTEYLDYRAAGRNRQSAKALRRQTAAVRAFSGAKYLQAADPTELAFYHGTEDGVFDASHWEELKDTVPDAAFHVLAGAGHMLNIEAPGLFQCELPADFERKDFSR